MVDQEVPNHWQGNCFGCSTVNASGLGLRFYLSENGCYTKCAVPDHLCGIDGLVHRSTIRSQAGETLAEGESKWRIGSPSLIARVSQVDESEIVHFLSHYPVNVA
jgi:hypothetical protein